ncbi:hypothetical protein CI610_00800 [invertebrate metagenome]|uniref:DUF2956 domain-containing protein n=1 Tax=invertebrate metagenome TaxID=1711999 RepID=A0A2H9TAT3_9ZZZZ
MANFSKKHHSGNSKTQAEALQIAKATQRPGQTKEQTRLIAQGIRKGIDIYKKQQKAKARELDKKLKKLNQPSIPETSEKNTIVPTMQKKSYGWFPWILLIITWISIGIYYVRLIH